MATQVKHRRGTNAEILAGTPAVGELWYNTDDNTVHMGDGVTPGGNKSVKREGDYSSHFATMAETVASIDTSRIYEGAVVTIGDRARGSFNVVLTSGVTPNGYDIVQCTGVPTLSLVLRTSNQVSALQYGISTTDPTNARVGLQLLNDELTVDGGSILLDAKFTINGGVKFSKNVSIVGVFSNTCGIICDYTSWTDLGLYSVTPNTGVFVEGGSDTDRGKGYGRVISNFFVQGINNSTIESTGMYIGIADRRLIPDASSSINFSVRGAKFNNLNVSQFDTALAVSEVWQSNFTSIEVLACRLCFNVIGQSVNNTLTDSNLNPALNSSYTSSTDNSECLAFRNYTNYGPTENKVGRPEGWMVTDTGMFSADVGVGIYGILSLTISQCVIDLHGEHSIEATSASGVVISDNYISSTGGDAGNGATIQLNATGLASDLDIAIVNNTLRRISVTGNEGMKAISCGQRAGVLIQGNSIGQYLASQIMSFDAPVNTQILNNRFQLNGDDFGTQSCIYIQGAASIVNVDGNISSTGNKILLFAVNGMTDIRIGKNNSTSQSTSDAGEITILAGQTSAFIDFTYVNTGIGAPGVTNILGSVVASPATPLDGFTVSPGGVNSRRCTFATTVAPIADTKIHYKLECYKV